MSFREKIVGWDALPKWRAQMRGWTQLVVTQRLLDLLHAGHVTHLEQAHRGLGDALLVGLNGNEAVRILKGADRPINNDRTRADLSGSLGKRQRSLRLRKRPPRGSWLMLSRMCMKGGDYTWRP